MSAVTRLLIGARLVPPVSDLEIADRILDRIKSLVIGGADVEPQDLDTRIVRSGVEAIIHEIRATDRGAT